jgi:tellurite resistance-related uncharacterized protein
VDFTFNQERQIVSAARPIANESFYIFHREKRARSKKSKKILQPSKDKHMALPLDAKAYRRTDIFTEATVPKPLLQSHTTKQGVWALIHVLEGRLIYRIRDPRRPASDAELTPETGPGIVEPTVLHEVEPLGQTRFYVDFYK